MTYTFKNVNLIPYDNNFELDDDCIKYLSLLDLNLSEFKNKIKPDIDYTFGNLHITSKINGNYFDKAFINLLDNLLIQVVKNRNEYTINAELNIKLDSKLKNFTQDLQNFKPEFIKDLKEDLTNEIFFYSNFKPVGIFLTDLVSFDTIVNNYVEGLNHLLIFNALDK